jgi:hypothetical protein
VTTPPSAPDPPRALGDAREPEPSWCQRLQRTLLLRNEKYICNYWVSVPAAVVTGGLTCFCISRCIACGARKEKKHEQAKQEAEEKKAEEDAKTEQAEAAARLHEEREKAEAARSRFWCTTWVSVVAVIGVLALAGLLLYYFREAPYIAPCIARVVSWLPVSWREKLGFDPAVSEATGDEGPTGEDSGSGSMSRSMRGGKKLVDRVTDSRRLSSGSGSGSLSEESVSDYSD